MEDGERAGRRSARVLETPRSSIMSVGNLVEHRLRARSRRVSATICGAPLVRDGCRPPGSAPAAPATLSSRNGIEQHAYCLREVAVDACAERRRRTRRRSSAALPCRRGSRSRSALRGRSMICGQVLLHLGDRESAQTVVRAERDHQHPHVRPGAPSRAAAGRRPTCRPTRRRSPPRTGSPRRRSSAAAARETPASREVPSPAVRLSPSITISGRVVRCGSADAVAAGAGAAAGSTP